MILEGFVPSRVADGHFELNEICTTQREADDLLRAMKLHQPHRGQHHVVSVTVSVVPNEARP